MIKEDKNVSITGIETDEIGSVLWQVTNSLCPSPSFHPIWPPGVFGTPYFRDQSSPELERSLKTQMAWVVPSRAQVLCVPGLCVQN